MKTYTIWAQERGGEFVRVPLRRAKETLGNAIVASLRASVRATLCEIVLTCGKAHVATFRNGKMIARDGKEQKP